MCIKFSLVVDAVFGHPVDKNTTLRRCFHSVLSSVLMADDITLKILNAFEEIKELIEQHTERGSGWHLLFINNIELKIGKYVPHRGGCYQHKLPDEINNKKCLLSIQTDNCCFVYSVLACLYPQINNGQRKHKYDKYKQYFDTTDVEGDVDLHQASSFEKKNNLCINIYTYDLNENVLFH